MTFNFSLLPNEKHANLGSRYYPSIPLDNQPSQIRILPPTPANT